MGFQVSLHIISAPSFFLTHNLSTFFYSFAYGCSACMHTVSHAYNDPHISDLLVSHCECSNKHNLRHLSSTQVQTKNQAPSSLKSTRGSANVFVRAKAKRPIALTCEAFFTRERTVYAQSDYTYRRHDRTDYHEITMERPLEPTECKHAIELTTLNLMILVIVALLPSLIIFKYNASLKPNNIVSV